jgi:hypothetical protein
MRIDAGALSDAPCESPTLRLFLLSFVPSLYVQTGFTALVNARCNTIEPPAALPFDIVSGLPDLSPTSFPISR